MSDNKIPLLTNVSQPLLQSQDCEPQIWASVIHHMEMSMAEHGVDVQQLFRECSINVQELERPHAQVPLTRYLHFLNKATEQTNEPLLHITIARSIGAELLGALGFLFLVSHTLYDALMSMSTYQNLLQGSTNMMLTREKGKYFFSYEIYGLPHIDVRHDVEFSLAFTNQLIRTYTNNKVKPKAISFRHSPISSVNRYERELGIPCYFNQDANLLHLDAEDISYRGSRFDPNLSQILKDYLDSDLLAKQLQSCFVEQVKNTILAIKPDQNVTAEVIASQLGLSPATFYRKLKRENASFKKILNEIQFDLACQYLKGTVLNIYQVSHILGFSSAASFTRAFTNWSGGITPRNFRNQQQ